MESSPSTDPDVASLQAGDAGSWEALFERMYPRMLAYAERRVGSREDARDAVSETFARLVKSLDRLQETAVTADGWCFGILHHVVMDTQRRSYRNRRGTPTQRRDEPEPADNLLLVDEHRAVRAAFDQLSPKDRDLLELRVVAGLSADEVATILDMGPGAVRMAQARALGRLRAVLDLADVDR